MPAISIIRGDTFRRVLTAKAGGTAVDLSGWQVAMQIREKTSRGLVLTLSPEITNAAAGQVTVELSDAETAAISRIGQFVTDFKFTTEAGHVVHSKPFTVSISDPVTE